MWVTIIWPDGLKKRQYMRTLRELDQLIGAQVRQGLLADLENAGKASLRVRLFPA
jgi:hypothetical protein